MHSKVKKNLTFTVIRSHDFLLPTRQILHAYRYLYIVLMWIQNAIQISNSKKEKFYLSTTTYIRLQLHSCDIFQTYITAYSTSFARLSVCKFKFKSLINLSNYYPLSPCQLFWSFISISSLWMPIYFFVTIIILIWFDFNLPLYIIVDV